ncbi:hypothetical protein VSU19_07325 [Verrucomicrobiales bacterium BCK34]|nr:hypothetical protein [Verrucomicrobiales bacterium BCK34]
MIVHFFGSDPNKLSLCEDSARRCKVESYVFASEAGAIRARSKGRPVAIASENILVNKAHSIYRDSIHQPGNLSAPHAELSIIGQDVELDQSITRVRDLNSGCGVIPFNHSPGFLAAFDPAVPIDYDFGRYREIPKFISFSKVPNRDGRRAAAMAEMLQLFNGEPFDFSNFLQKRIVRELITGLSSGERVVPSEAGRFGVERIVAVCDSGYSDDLWRLIPTVVGHHPDTDFILFCDEAAEVTAKEVIARMIPSCEHVQLRPVITEESIRDAEKRFNGVNQSGYWKPGPIWWKLEALRRVLAEKAVPTLLVDCDITFTAPLRDTFSGVDLVMSPFYWPNPELKVPLRPGSHKYVPIAERDGWYNAGYILATRVEVAETWMDLYMQSVGGFYEQFCMGYLPQRFRHTVFGTPHNWGQWRCEIPPPEVVSVHAHRRTEHTHAYGQAIQEVAEKSANQFLR